MAVGLATAHANELLNVYRGTSVPGFTAYGKLHIGDPGAAGTGNPSAVTTRAVLSFSVAASGLLVLSSPPSWSMTATEAISHLTIWDAPTAGNFKRSIILSVPLSVLSGDTVSLTALTLGYVLAA